MNGLQVGLNGGRGSISSDWIAEQVQQTAQLDYDKATEAAKDLRDTQAKLLEVIPKLINARAVLRRTVVR